MLPSAFVSEYLIQGSSGDSFFGIDGAVPDGTDAFSEADPATVKPSWVHAAKSLSTFEESDLARRDTEESDDLLRRCPLGRLGEQESSTCSSPPLPALDEKTR